MHHIISSNKKTDYKKTIADFDRPFMCTCFCCCRPVMEGFFKGDDEQEKEDINENKNNKKRKKRK